MYKMSLETIQSELTALRSEVKALTKLVRKVKNTQEDPDGEKAKARAANNGFNRKQEVTPKLRGFLGLAEGELISRSEVTKAINKYITEKDFQKLSEESIVLKKRKSVYLENSNVFRKTLEIPVEEVIKD